MNLLGEGVQGRLLHAALVEQEEYEGSEESSSTSTTCSRGTQAPAGPTFDVPYFRYIDEEEGVEAGEEWSNSSRSLSSTEEDSAVMSCDRDAMGSRTPDKILEQLLDHVTLGGPQETTMGKESDALLDDFLLTYLVFMSTSDLCQALLGQYPSTSTASPAPHKSYWISDYQSLNSKPTYLSKHHRGNEDVKDALDKKRKVLHLVIQWTALCRDFLWADEHVKVFIKNLYRYVLDDLHEHPSLEKDLSESKTISQEPQRESKEVLCHVHLNMVSYLSVRTRAGVAAQGLLEAVAKRVDVPAEDLVLVAITYTGGRRLLQPQDRLHSDWLSASRRLHVCKKDLSEIMNPFTDNGLVQQRTVCMLSMNTWEVAVALTNFAWTIFESIHKQELVSFTFSRHASSHHTVALTLMLQRFNEVQLWVSTEVLLCPTLCKRVELIKKFIKIASHCKAQRNTNCLFAVIMGLNTAAVTRLSQTWERVPGRFKKLFSELETITDPSFNHKAYRDSFRKMKGPKIPFLPLLLKDITFIHEGNKTFLDNRVNFEKLHMIADTVRQIRQCQNDHLGSYIIQKNSPEVRVYIDYLHIIDNQQTLFELSHRLEPRA
ncbi:hypothetical protein NHX12_001447 [Muraenolepis orangiensis]|uniref:Rap guanine nucleotide exchange factor 5 n=1 Tax=Muraenolepis orangiensis TaxID=630683 RepID=A0A9Q0E241_9TELE|nr:hypothetical protein NHX12_001447 [Muraenolepis orangiensis]